MPERAFDKFTKRTKQVLQYATEEARAFNHSYIGTEHILLGLIREGEGVAAQVLNNLGIKLSQARHAVEFIVGVGEGPPRTDQDLTDRAKKVIEYALEETKRLNHHYIGTEHLLLGLVRNGEGVATGVLDILGVSLEQLRTQVMRVLRQGPTSGMDRSSTSASGLSAQRVSKTLYLDALSIDLTEMAEADRLDPLIGRERESEQLVQVLTQRLHSIPVLVGEPGVGKTALVHGLAQRIVIGNVPSMMRGKRIVALDTGALLAGDTKSGQAEERLKRLLQEAEESRTIIFIDKLHSFFGAGDQEDLLPLGRVLQQALLRNSIQFIGETYPLEYRSFIAPNTALRQYIQQIVVSSPGSEDVLMILQGLKTRFEDHHQLFIADEAIQAAVLHAEHVRPDLSLVERALQLIDGASARVIMYRSATPPALRDALRGLEAIRREREAALEEGQKQSVEGLRVREEQMSARIAKIERELGIDAKSSRPYVTEADILDVVRDSEKDEDS